MPWIASIPLIIGAACALILLWQDMRGRWIHLVPAILLGVAGLAWRLALSHDRVALDFLVCAAMIGVMLALSAIVMRFLRRGANFVDELFGMGDIVFLFAGAAWLDPMGFLVFFVSGLLWVLAAVGIQVMRKRWSDASTIPLAGLLAGYLVFFVPIYWFTGMHAFLMKLL